MEFSLSNLLFFYYLKLEYTKQENIIGLNCNYIKIITVSINNEEVRAVYKGRYIELLTVITLIGYLLIYASFNNAI